MHAPIICDRLRKPAYWIFVKVEFMYGQYVKFQIDCALCCGDTALCLRSRHTPDNREIAVQRCWRFDILCMTRKSITWTWVEPFERSSKS